MNISPETLHIISALEEYSQQSLGNRTELSELIELAARFKKEKNLADASFSAKGTLNIFRIIQRNKPDAQGYDKLLQEFQEQLHRTTTNIHTLLENAPAEIHEKFSQQFLGQTQDAFANFLGLCADLRLLKNWNIDSKQSKPTS